jgi:hypothetical protein
MNRTRKVLSTHKHWDDAKQAEADLINKGADPKFLQVRRKADRFELVERQ